MTVRVLEGDCREVLAGLPDECVQCVVTSPPYWGLRDYGVTGQLGLERTPDEYVARMVDVFREVRRVLRDDGVMWLNLGDSYSRMQPDNVPQSKNRRVLPPSMRERVVELAPKNLVGIPWRVAFALQADGWFLRSEIIWHKPNPMPESVTDRPTKSHEQIFLLTKSERYWYDAEAIAEPVAEGSVERYAYAFGGAKSEALIDANKTGVGVRTRVLGTRDVPATRNARSVWTVATQPYSGAHFATFPPKLIEPCVLAGSAARACEHCGAAWRRVTDGATYYAELSDDERNQRTRKTNAVGNGHGGAGRGPKNNLGSSIARTIGWEPSCPCPNNTGAARSVVLDPFGGAGTTGLVADRLGRDAVLIELNPEYAAMARARIKNDNPLFTDVA